MKLIRDKRELNDFISNGNSLKVVKFSADWCGPCKNLSKVITEIENDMNNVDFCEIDVDTYPDSLEEYGIRSIPLMVFYMDGMIVDKTVGSMNRFDLKNKIDENINK